MAYRQHTNRACAPEILFLSPHELSLALQVCQGARLGRTRC